MANFVSALIFCAVALQAVLAVPIKNPDFGPQINFTVGGEDYSYVEDQPFLQFSGIAEVCETGVWLMYSGNDFVLVPGWNTIEILYQIDAHCQVPRSPRVGSARFAGIRGDYTTPSVTLYGATDLTGEALTFAGEIPLIEMQFLSLLTINTEVELFEQENYGGRTYCVPGDTCLGGVCWNMVWYGDEVPWNVYAAKSARAGCQSQSNAQNTKSVQHNGFYSVQK